VFNLRNIPKLTITDFDEFIPSIVIVSCSYTFSSTWIY